MKEVKRQKGNVLIVTVEKIGKRELEKRKSGMFSARAEIRPL
jgi:hypothetical protein